MQIALRTLVGVFLSATSSLAGVAAETATPDLKATPGIVAEKPTEGIYVQTESGFMVPYQVTIPGTKVTFEMIPVPGGSIQIGTPESEAGHQADEASEVTVEVAPFWMGKTEVTWAEYKKYMGTYNLFKNSRNIPPARKVTADKKVDAVTIPTPLYMPPYTFEFGEDPKQPAVTMTQFAAKQYTKWISGLTGHQYRLPTEGEWEYAARAGSRDAYSFGSDASKLSDYGNFKENSPSGPSKVGLKKPNAFGLYDMHGNVWEWTVDGYTEDGFKSLGSGTLPFLKAIQWPTEATRRVVRGGGWQDAADRCRSGARMFSLDDDENWKSEDPNIPLSPWWYTSDPAREVGMRLVRSYQPLSKEELTRFWEADHPDIIADVEARIEEGRASVGLPVPELGDDLRKLP
jgi:formylglycine-generating enzyme